MTTTTTTFATVRERTLAMTRALMEICKGAKPKIRLRYGEKVTPSGSVSPTWAVFNLASDYKGDATIDAMLAHLEAGNKNKDGIPKDVTVSIPKDSDATMCPDIAPYLDGPAAAAFLREWGNHSA